MTIILDESTGGGMPVYSRRSIRQRLGLEYLRDTIVGQTSGSWGTQAGSANIIDSAQADPTASGEHLYERAWLRLLGSAGKIQDLRVGSFNTGSGAYMSMTTLGTTIFSGMPFEVSTLLDPKEKDRAIDDAIRDLRMYNEVPIWTVDNSTLYSVGSDILSIQKVRYYSTPTDSLNLGEHVVDRFDFAVTSTGNVLRIGSALSQSQQLILDALLTLTLGAGDLATINLISDTPVLWGATARCYWLLERKGPAQEVARYKDARMTAAKAFTKSLTEWLPVKTKKIQLDEKY